MDSSARSRKLCRNKSSYATQKDAEMGIKHFAGKLSTDAGRLKAYKCLVEGVTHWHLGRVKAD